MSEQMSVRKILVLGASGLIGRFVTGDLRAQGFHVIGIARRYPPSQKTDALDLEMPLMSMDSAALARLIWEHDMDVVVNCLGVLQDGPGSDTGAVHRDFVDRLLDAIRGTGRAIRLLHISHRLQHDQTRSRADDRRDGNRLRDPAAGLCDRAVGLWRQRHAARAGGVSD